MAVIKPFVCVRPNERVASRVAALPYDVYDRQEARVEARKDPLSFLNIDRAETQFEESMDIYDERVYEKAKELLNKRLQDGTFIVDEDRCYYLYELTMEGRAQTGIVGCASIDDYENGVIKRHENTRAEKEEDRIRHVDVCDAQTGPIFLAYHAEEEIRNVVMEEKKKQAIYDFVSADGIRHRVWKVADSNEIQAIQNAFFHMDRIYIADGHHRAASAVKVGKKRRAENPGYSGEEAFHYFLTVLFPDDELRILAYNRLVRDLNGLEREDFLKKIEQQGFEVTRMGEMAYYPVRRHEMGMYLDGKWYRLTMGSELCLDDPVKGLDVSILQDHLLDPVLGIGDPRTDERVDFMGGIKGVEELERRVHMDMRIAFLMFPTSMEELFAIADAGLLMPPKSTWFEPKLRSGLFIHPLRS